jgi:uncharacterized membrane protein
MRRLIRHAMRRRFRGSVCDSCSVLVEEVPFGMARFGRTLAALGLMFLLTTLVGVPIVGGAAAVTITTPYPAVAVAPGTKVSFDLSIDTPDPTRVDLAVHGTPADWTAQLFGGGFVVDGVQTTGKASTSVRLDVTVPATAEAKTNHMEVVATTSAGSATLPLDIRINPAAAGDVTLTTDFPQLKGPSTSTFAFNLTLHNDTAEDLTFTGVATGPAGWTVTTQVSSESQAASAIVKAGSTTPVTVTATAPDNVVAGVYPISVDVTSGERTAHQDLAVEITGSYKLSLTTPDGRLNAQGSAGSPTTLTLVVQNDGTAVVEGVKMGDTAPAGWKVAFDQPTVNVPPGQQVQVIATLTPSGDAIAGDYVTTFTATADQANASADIRVTIETSLLWGAVGIGLIVLVLGGLWWIFRRYGRR